MFDDRDVGVGLLAGESTEDVQAEVDLSYRLTCLALADGWTEPNRDLLPDGLEGIPVGPFLAAMVSSVDRSRLNGHDAVRLMQAETRLSSAFEAGRLASMTVVAFSPAGDADSGVERCDGVLEYAAVEIAAALTLTRRASETLLSMAVSLTGRLIRVWQAFSQGLIDLAKTRVLVDLLAHLPEETVDVVLDRVLDEAPGLTTGQLRARTLRVVMTVDPDGSASSFRQGLEDRRVVTSANPDFTADLAVRNADPVRVAAARRHVETLARQIRSISGEHRGLDQIRADVVLDLLSGRCTCDTNTNSGAGRVGVIIPAATLEGSSDEPGELTGLGPVLAEVARKTALHQVDGEWDYTVVSDNGMPLATGTLTRRPSRAMRRRLGAVYPKCVAPGCRFDVWDCDLDHRHPHSQGGATRCDNLAPLCRHHHKAKHDGGWQLQRLEDGDHQWTSPPGHTYHTRRGPPE